MSGAERFEDLAHFLDVAKGSAGEVRSMLHCAADRTCLTAAEAQTLRTGFAQRSRQLAALAGYLRRR